MKRSKLTGWQLGMMRGAHEPPPVPSSFDLLLHRLGISEKDAAGNAMVIMWVRANHRHFFVPEKILSAAGIDEDFL
jgi:hypothetical protein